MAGTAGQALLSQRRNIRRSLQHHNKPSLGCTNKNAIRNSKELFRGALQEKIQPWPLQRRQELKRYLKERRIQSPLQRSFSDHGGHNSSNNILPSLRKFENITEVEIRA